MNVEKREVKEEVKEVIVEKVEEAKEKVRQSIFSNIFVISGVGVIVIGLLAFVIYQVYFSEEK